MIVLYPLCCASVTAFIVSVTVPIWFTFTSNALAIPLSIPCCNLVTFVTNKSSPTNWHLSPTVLVRNFQPSQSSSAMPSSLEAIGYCFTHFSHYSTNWSHVISLQLLL